MQSRKSSNITKHKPHESLTAVGKLIENLDRIPEVGDSFEYEGLEFTVTRAENNRAEEITVKGEPLTEQDEEE